MSLPVAWSATVVQVEPKVSRDGKNYVRVWLEHEVAQHKQARMHGSLFDERAQTLTVGDVIDFTAEISQVEGTWKGKPGKTAIALKNLALAGTEAPSKRPPKPKPRKMALPFISEVARLMSAPTVQTCPTGLVAHGAILFQPEGDTKGNAFSTRYVAFGETAAVFQGLNEGDLVEIMGRLKTTTWQDKRTRERKYGSQITAESVRVATEAPAASQQSKSEPPSQKLSGSGGASEAKTAVYGSVMLRNGDIEPEVRAAMLTADDDLPPF